MDRRGQTVCDLGKERKSWISVDDVVRVEGHSLSDYLKRTNVNLDKVLDDFVKEKKKKQELICERMKMKLDNGVTSHYIVSIRQELIRKA